MNWGPFLCAFKVEYKGARNDDKWGAEYPYKNKGLEKFHYKENLCTKCEVIWNLLRAVFVRE